MRYLIILLALVVVVTACKGEKKQGTEEKIISPKTEKKDINDLIVFENLLMKADVEEAIYNRIKFDKDGALFSKEKNTYIKIPFTELDVNKGFNLSFSFMTTDGDGSKPQSLIAFVDKYSSASRIPFYIYFPGNRISGVYGKQLFWAEGYNAKNGNSRVYYDSFPLKTNQFYFVSVNFDGAKVDIYVNSEIYATFNDLSKHDFKMDHVLIGALLPNNEIAYPFSGNIHGLKIFNEPLRESEIVDVFNSQPIIDKGY